MSMTRKCYATGNPAGCDMTLTRPIPALAMPVAKVIRRDVARPKRLPKLCNIPDWDGEGQALRWRVSRNFSCPMGQHPLAWALAPTERREFPIPGCNQASIGSFGKWWDEQTDPLAAVNAVWGKRGKR